MRYGTLDGMQSSEAVATAVGRNVRALRQQRRMTIDALAAASGVSRGTVIQVETARGNPSIGTLCNLAAALRVGVASLVDGDAAPRVVVRRGTDAAQLWTSAGGQQRGVPHRHRPARRRRAVGLDAAARRRLRGRGAPDRHPGGALGARRARWRCGWAPPTRSSTPATPCCSRPTPRTATPARATGPSASSWWCSNPATPAWCPRPPSPRPSPPRADRGVHGIPRRRAGRTGLRSALSRRPGV